MPKSLQVFEHAILRVESAGLTRAEFDALVRFNQRHEDRFFVVRHESLKFTSYVGVLQVGGLTIEVLPKADRSEIGGEKKWHRALIDMLKACGYLKLAAVSSADLHLRRASLFDLYMETYLTEVDQLLHQGLVKKYRQVTGNVTALKGRLLFGRNVAENLVHRERFYTAHHQYDRNNQFNRIPLRAASVVAGAARSNGLRRRAVGLLPWMEDVDDVPVTDDTFLRLAYDRNSERYRLAMSLARLIILNYQPDVTKGGHDVLAILFDMNELFEAYVLHQLRRAAAHAGSDIEVHGQDSRLFWRADGASRAIRPDIVVRLVGPTGDRATVTLDTKWKVPTSGHPDDSDLKQIYAYNLQFGATRGYLLYPQVSDRADVSGWFEAPAHDVALKHGCGMRFLQLFDANGGLQKNLGAKILAGLGAAQDLAA